MSLIETSLNFFPDTGLVFIVLPLAITNFQPSTLWSALFFLMIILMGMSSILVMIEVVVTVIIDEKVTFRNSRVLVLLGVCCLFYVLGLPLTTRVSGT